MVGYRKEIISVAAVVCRNNLGKLIAVRKICMQMQVADIGVTLCKLALNGINAESFDYFFLSVFCF